MKLIPTEVIGEPITFIGDPNVGNISPTPEISVCCVVSRNEMIASDIKYLYSLDSDVMYIHEDLIKPVFTDEAKVRVREALLKGKKIIVIDIYNNEKELVLESVTMDSELLCDMNRIIGD